MDLLPGIDTRSPADAAFRACELADALADEMERRQILHNLKLLRESCQELTI